MPILGFLTLSLLVFVVCLKTRAANGRYLRSDDPSPLEIVVERLSNNYDTLQAKVAGQERRIEELEEDNKRTVLFSAYIPEGHPIAASRDTIIAFSAIITNVGNAYNPATGVFTCPRDGNYFFSVNLDVTHDYDHVMLRKNGHDVAAADHDDTVSTHLSATAILNLKTGDVVTVNQISTTGRTDSGNDCTFMGFLLR